MFKSDYFKSNSNQNLKDFFKYFQTTFTFHKSSFELINIFIFYIWFKKIPQYTISITIKVRKYFALKTSISLIQEISIGTAT